MKNFFPAIALSLCIFTPAFAADSLDAARNAGRVGETANGYIEATGSATPDTKILVSSVNTGRRNEYQKIAAQNGQPMDVVEKLAAQKIFSTLPAGTPVQNASGGWTKK